VTQEIRTRLHMVSYSVGWCATERMRCERMVSTDTGGQYCLDSVEPLSRLRNCVKLGKECQAEHDSSRRPPPKAWIQQKTRKRSEYRPREKGQPRPRGFQGQCVVTCKQLEKETHCRTKKKRCEWLRGRVTFSCEWLGCDIGRTAYGPVRPLECQDEPADEKEEK
jgi:hypothetical protein